MFLLGTISAQTILAVDEKLNSCIMHQTYMNAMKSNHLLYMTYFLAIKTEIIKL